MFNRILLVLNSHAIDQPSIRQLSFLKDDSTAIEIFEPVHEPLLDGYLGNTEVYEPLRRRVLAEKAAQLNELANSLESQGVRCTAKALWDYPRDQAIAREAHAFGADLVITTPESDGRLHWTSSDWRLVAHCPVPMLIVKGDGLRAYRKIVAAVDPLHRHAKPEHLDDAIVACARALQTRLKATMSLLHCFVPLANLKYQDVDQFPLYDAERALEQSRQQALDSLAEGAGLPPGATRLVEGLPHSVLKVTAEKGDVDLIVMGGLSRGMLSDLFIGSTAEKVLRRVNCDVLIVKPPTNKIRDAMSL